MSEENFKLNAVFEKIIKLCKKVIIVHQVKQKTKDYILRHQSFSRINKTTSTLFRSQKGLTIGA